MSAAPEEIDWRRLDKTKFLWVGAGLFSGVTTVLYPLSVVKTQQMAIADAPRGLRGAQATAAAIVRADGVRGLYRGFGTTIFGLVPARGIYLTTLERVKDVVQRQCGRRGWGAAETAALASSVGGGVASLATQSVIVPVDVVTQRLMVAGSGGVRGQVAGQAGRLDPAAVAARGRRLNGLQMAQKIVRAEGLLGLYRGFGLSVVTFVPSSALWWGAYGGYQKLIWQQLDGLWDNSAVITELAAGGGGGGGSSDGGGSSGSGSGCGSGSSAKRPTSQVMGVQTLSAVCAGLTSSVFTNPLDVLKTRLQVTEGVRDGSKPSLGSTLRTLLQSDGMWGLWRGVGPRILSSMLWGSSMVTAYEYLKRVCALPNEAAASED